MTSSSSSDSGEKLIDNYLVVDDEFLGRNAELYDILPGNEDVTKGADSIEKFAYERRSTGVNALAVIQHDESSASCHLICDAIPVGQRDIVG